MKSLNEIVAELRMGDDGGKPAYRIGRADKVEVSMPSGTPVRSYVIECVTIKELADWIEAAVARKVESADALRGAIDRLPDITETDARSIEHIAKYAMNHSMYGGGIIQAMTGAVREAKRVLAEQRGCAV